MDPISIISTITTIGQTVFAIKDFIKSVTEARQDLAAISKQLERLESILSRLKVECGRDEASDPDLKPLLDTVSASVRDCKGSVENVMAVLKKYQRGGITAPVSWAASGKQDVEDLRKDLNTCITTLQVSLSSVQFTLTRAIRSDTSALVQDSAQIKQQLAAILRAIQKLQQDAPGDATAEIQQQLLNISNITGMPVQSGVAAQQEPAPGSAETDQDFPINDESIPEEPSSSPVLVVPDEPHPPSSENTTLAPPLDIPRPSSSHSNKSGKSGPGMAAAQPTLLRSFHRLRSGLVGHDILATIDHKGAVEIYDLPSLKKAATLALGGKEAIYLKISPDSRRLIVLCRDRGSIWSIPQGQCEDELPGHLPALSRNRLAISHDGTMVATTGRKETIEIWRKQDCGFSRVFKDQLRERVESFQFSSKGDLLGVFCSYIEIGFVLRKRFYVIEVWSTSELRRLRSINLGHSQKDGQQNVRFIEDTGGGGFSAVSMADGTQGLTFWDLSTGSPTRSVRPWSPYKGHALPRTIPGLFLSGSCRLVVLDRLVRSEKRQQAEVWDLESERLVGTIKASKGQLRLSGASLDGDVKIVCMWRDFDNFEVYEVTSLS